MSLKYGKAEIKTMIEAFDQDHETIEEAALAALAAAEEIFEKRANFTVVGQVRGTKERMTIPPDDPEAVKMALGWYSTAGDAEKAAQSLWTSTASGDQLRVWVLPTFHGTPADWHGKRRDDYKAKQQKANQDKSEKFLKSIVKHREAMEERAREYREKEAA